MYYPRYGHGFHSVYPATVNTIKDRKRKPKQRQVQVNTPFLPILGEQSSKQLIEHIQKSIRDEAAASELYSRLIGEAPDELHKEFLRHAYEDELKHLEAFNKLYAYINGEEPQLNMVSIEYSNYKEGILKALKDELKAAEFYRDILLASMTDPVVRDTFFYALVD